ncbi:MAG: hypothetical protein IIB31_09890 [Chloroflexi bacterium]|nr:hypothetical protein [Chloroflexota bacterium]
MDRWVRWGVLLLLALLVLAPGYFALRAFQSPTTEVIQVPDWGWVQWGEWDYSVFLRPNTVYGVNELGPDHTYYSTLVDSIEARFSYNFTTDTPASIEGWYEITTTLAVGELPAERILLVPRTPFVEQDSTQASFALTLPIDRQTHQDRVQEILAETGVQTRVDATVTYVAHVEVTATTGRGAIEEVLEPTLVVPLSEEAFEITGERTLQDNGVVYTTQVRPILGVEDRLRNWLILTAVTPLIAVGFFLLTASKPAGTDPLAQEVRRIRRKYRKRIVHAGPGAATLPGGEVVVVAGMDDLARVSEELLKPIIYTNSDRQGGAHVFYIVDGTTRYQYRLAGD